MTDERRDEDECSLYDEDSLEAMPLYLLSPPTATGVKTIVRNILTSPSYCRLQYRSPVTIQEGLQRACLARSVQSGAPGGVHRNIEQSSVVTVASEYEAARPL